MKTYRVLRQHLGDRMYMPGDEREADGAEVTHLVRNGVLGELGEVQGGRRPTVKRRASGAAPENKGK